MNEFELIRKYFAKFPTDASVLEGIGDDAAVLRTPKDQLLVQSVDTLIAGVHFPMNAKPDDIAHKALMVNLSDMAAMAATPLWFTLSITLPEVDENWLGEFAACLQTLCQQNHLNLIGGDTTRGALAIAINMTGSVAPSRYTLRRGAQVNDDIYVSGTIGDAALGLAIWQGKASGDFDAAEPLARFHRPQARLELAQALGGVASSMIDCSDGLFADLGHILAQSEVAAEVQLADIPVSSALSTYCKSENEFLSFLNGGDDYELIFTAPADHREKIKTLSKALTPGVQPIGQIVAGTGMLLQGEDGKKLQLESSGYKHFV